MSITRRIFLGYLLLALLFIACAVGFGFGVLLLYDKDLDTQTQARELTDSAAQAQTAISALVTDFRIEAAGLKGTRNAAAGDLEVSREDQARSVAALIDDLRAQVGDDAEEAELADQLADQIDDFVRLAASADSNASYGAGSTTMEAILAGALAKGDQVQKLARQIVEATRVLAEERADDARARSRRFQLVMQVGFVAGAVFALLFAFMQPRAIARRLRGVVGDLSTAAAETLAVASQVSSSAVQTATAVSEAATTIDEVRQTTMLTSQKATAVADTARAADEVAEAGRAAVSRATERMHGIHDQMTTLADSVASLTEQTESASGIIATINDISEQSRLLSVNAAIEAVKAADLGHGFGVVAEEIKDLAVQSKQGVVSVRSVLGEIQRATGGAVMAAEQSGRAIEVGVAETDELRDAIESLADGVASAAQSALQIEASAQQELVGMDQISDAMASIDQASAQNAAGAGQLEVEAEHLRQLALRLERVISSRSDETDDRPAAGGDDAVVD
jgi:hypothetical protein